MTSRKLEIKFDLECVRHWASKYEYEGENDVIQLVEEVRSQSYLTKSDLQIVANWKSPRSAGKIETNEENFVQEVTQFALKTEYDKAAIESLTVLYGVGAATASVILHFFHKKDYPILDFRALWSVSLIDDDKYYYSYALWSKYVEYCRELAKKEDVSMRTLDRALWQYSKSNQQ